MLRIEINYLSNSIDCQKIHFRLPTEAYLDQTIVLDRVAGTLSSWHCQQLCQAEHHCKIYTLDLFSIPPRYLVDIFWIPMKVFSRQTKIAYW